MKKFLSFGLSLLIAFSNTNYVFAVNKNHETKEYINEDINYYFNSINPYVYIPIKLKDKNIEISAAEKYFTYSFLRINFFQKNLEKYKDKFSIDSERDYLFDEFYNYLIEDEIINKNEWLNNGRKFANGINITINSNNNNIKKENMNFLLDVIKTNEFKKLFKKFKKKIKLEDIEKFKSLILNKLNKNLKENEDYLKRIKKEFETKKYKTKTIGDVEGIKAVENFYRFSDPKLLKILKEKYKTKKYKKRYFKVYYEDIIKTQPKILKARKMGIEIIKKIDTIKLLKIIKSAEFLETLKKTKFKKEFEEANNITETINYIKALDLEKYELKNMVEGYKKRLKNIKMFLKKDKNFKINYAIKFLENIFFGRKLTDEELKNEKLLIKIATNKIKDLIFYLENLIKNIKNSIEH